ncbi:MAG: penicillin-binding transpeptidase domain-containing protein, partial [Bdellovibrionales bacterium]|jgi:membrane peptidoglycan carboxypeptidase|nr:penicillin-binding transpeptidase domain-containing protein [Bdellovibrionales bacterium]
LARSSNIVSTKVAQMLGDEALRQAYRDFGFGEPTGVDLPGEARGVLHELPWREHLLANISFGHGVSTTALQVANAYAAVANGGWLRRPYIVKAIHDPESRETIETKPQTVRRVLSDEAASKLRLMLSAVTTGNGSGLNARVPGFPVGGKTGTAQRVLEGGRGYEPGAYVSSFVGFLPVNDPKYVIFVSLDKPQKNFYGSAVAAPVFARIGKYAVTRAGLEPVLISAKNIIPRDAALKARNPKADAASWRAEHGLRTAQEKLEEKQEQERRREEARREQMRLARLSLDIMASRAPAMTDLTRVIGDMWNESEPVEPQVEESEAVAEGEIKVPDVVGMSLREAMEAFVQAGIPWDHVVTKGQGFVSHQKPDPGHKWQPTRGSRRATVELGLTFTQSVQ